MRHIAIALILAAPLIQGCYGYVKTFDGNGGLIAECREGSVILGFIPVNFWKPVPSCRGSANPLDQTANAIIHTEVPLSPKKPEECRQGTVWQNGECYPENSLLNEVLKNRKIDRPTSPRIIRPV